MEPWAPVQKKTGESRAYCSVCILGNEEIAKFPGPLAAGRQKGGPYADIKGIKGNGKSDGK